MNTLDNYVRKNGMSEVVEELNRLQNGTVEQHHFVEDKKIEVEDWFNFLWELDLALGEKMPVVEFNYLKVGEITVNYVEDNKPVEFDEIIKHVSNEVENASEEDVDRWVGGMMATEMDIDDDGKVHNADYIFDYNRD